MDSVVKGILSIIIVVGGGVMIWLIPSAKTELVAIIMVVVGYHFGSSEGSRSKDNVIRTMQMR